MNISREEVLHVALLARVGVTEEDVARFQEQLSNILENLSVLQKVDTTGVPPTAHSIALENVMKEDVVAPSLPQEEVLANAPQREAECLRVKVVLED